MKRYLLLRNNQESGPYTIEKISSLGLRPFDLVWIEDESSCWKYPEEIEELKPFIKFEAEAFSESRPVKKDRIFISLPSGFVRETKQEVEETIRMPHHQSTPLQETGYIRPDEALKENDEVTKPTKPIWNKRLFRDSNHAAIAAVFAGVVFGSFVIKKMVDGYVPDASKETSVAAPIVEKPLVKEANENFKNALVTEIVSIYKLPAKKSKPANIKSQLKIKTNSYKVGLFGGINGLQLTVFNPSDQFVDKIVVALDYLRPNGDVVQSENVSFTSIRPKGSQTIAIPGSNRGVKVKYKILKVYAHNYKADLKQV